MRVAVLAWAAGLAGCRGAAAPPPSPGVARLEELSDLGQLRDHFNRDRGTVRIVLLLSPT